SNASAASRTATTPWAASAPPTNRPGSTPAAGSDHSLLYPCRSAWIGVIRGRASVTRDRAVGLFGPGIDAALDVVDLAEAELAEVSGHLGAAAAVVAEKGERRVLRQGFEFGRAVVQGGMRGRDLGHGAFLRRAHVDQADVAGGGARLRFGGRK